MEDKQLHSFLSKVDEIQSIVRGLATGDENEASEAIDKADEFLKNVQEVESKKKHEPRDNTGVNRTVINQKAFDSPGDHMGPEVQSGMNQESFMAALEADAEARGERKRRAREEATVIKDIGNKEFQAGNYDKAVEYYTLALGKFKEMTALWTNRAQAYIKLGEYDKALSDCDWALRVFENCVKAYVHQGRAHMGLKQYDKAIESYESAMKCDPKKEAVLTDYIAEVERTRLADEQLQAAEEFSKTGVAEAQDIAQLLKKITKEDQLPMYYSGGIRILSNMLTGANEKTLFRTNGGITLTKDHFLIARCFTASPRSLSRDELMLCSSTLDCLQCACTENDENQKQLFDISELPEQLLRFVESKHKACSNVRHSVIKLLHIFSEAPYGRSLVVSRFDLPRLLTCLFPLMRGGTNTGSLASGLLRNLALDKKFRAHFRGDIDQNVLPNFETLMTDENSTLSVLPACTGVMTNLCGDDQVRRKLINRRETWEACCAALERFIGKRNQPITDEILESLLSLVMNMTYESSENAKQSALRICKSCCALLLSSEARSSAFEKRILGVTSRVLPLDNSAVVYTCDSNTLPLLVQFIQNEDDEFVKPAMRCLVSCTQQHEPARTQVIKCNKGLATLVGLLKHEDEAIVGNAALCLSHLTDVPKVPEKLTKTNIIQHLLVLTRDGRKEALMENCAILTAKLAQADTRHLERLRELHGIEILHTAMKYVKS